MRISITPQVPPGLLARHRPRAGQVLDGAPGARGELDVINAQDDQLYRRPLAVALSGCDLFIPALHDETALARLWEELISRAAAGRARPGRRMARPARTTARRGQTLVDAYRFDALRFEGPGTDLTVGLLPTSRFASETPGMADGRRDPSTRPNLPTEEIVDLARPNPQRTVS